MRPGVSRATALLCRALLVLVVGALAACAGPPEVVEPLPATPTGSPTTATPGGTPGGTPTGVTSPTPTPKPLSPLLVYGTNMALYDTGDQIANKPATQQTLKQHGIPIMRVPSRFTLADADMVRALQAVKSIGALPLFIVHGPTDTNALTDDQHLITLAQSVFGNSTVYIEYGNESDLAGINATDYTASWNAVVPQLKAMAPTYKFIGPVTFQADPTYVATFDKNANPRPDFNSWHEYACHPGDSDAHCTAQLATWTEHIQQTNDAVRAAIGTTIPIMITEWNLDAEPDARYHNAAYIRQWTTDALHTLASNVHNGLAAAMQYVATNNPNFSLLDGANQPTLQGAAFFQALDVARGDP